MKKKLYTVLIDGNYPYGGGMTLDFLREFLKDKDVQNGFSLTKEQIDDAIAKADKLGELDVFNNESIHIDCDSIEFGHGNGHIEIRRGFF